jgi:hypothetical protein
LTQFLRRQNEHPKDVERLVVQRLVVQRLVVQRLVVQRLVVQRLVVGVQVNSGQNA